ncbi:cell wall integrity and stress response component 2-like [Gambusia affinis]|uniref:cell wall integrity and stress response component 2-like n=1 Tax=Gambusia affinis TaxID=33528 RepID=UPI001CDBD260|nr:cell wall integrity and stress response component 2-like [Gambusia affinis]
MPAAMHLTVLLSLLTATACRGSAVSSAMTTTSASHVTTTSASHVTTTSASLATSSTVKTSTVTPQLQTTTQMITNLTSASPQTATAEKTGPSSAPLNTTITTITQTSNQNVTQDQTVALTSLNVTAGTSGNKTSSGNKENYNLVENPGLVTVICIFSIVFGLLLVVLIVKCVRSSRSDFERLEDVPMGKVNEASPFAQYTK